MIIWLASYPRSGNTFLRMLLHHSCGFKTYSTYNDPLFDQLGATDAVGQERLSAPLEELAKAPETYLVKTHDLPTDKSPAIYVVRDGRDSLVSLARYLLSFERKPSMMKTIKEMLGIDNFSTVLEELIIKKEHYGGWNDHVLTWLHRDHNGPQIVIRYEELVNDPDKVVANVLKTFDLKPVTTGGKMPDFATLHRKWPRFFRKGKPGSWREEMSDALHDLFWQHHAAAMNALGYKR